MTTPGVRPIVNPLTPSGVEDGAMLDELLLTLPARDVEVVARGLEDAFIALTTDERPGQ